MTKENWMYVAIAAAVVGAYFYMQNSKIKAEIKKTGATVATIANAAGVKL